MQAPDANGALSARSGLATLDPAARRRVESGIRNALRVVDAGGWAIGVFDTKGSLLALDMSAPGSERAALALLYLVPLPESLGPVRLKPTGRPHEKLPLALGTALRIDTDRSLALVLLRPQRAEQVWSREAETIQRSARQIGRAFVGVDSLADDSDVFALRGHSEGFFLLSGELEVELEWHSENAAPDTLAALVQSHAHRLPLFLERCVRELTASWNFARVATCVAGTAQPVAGLNVRVVPMRRGEAIAIGVFLERSTDSHDVDATASQYRISPREKEVLHAMLEGQSVAEIAASLNLAESTVNDHIARMIAKTNSRNRIEMAARLLGWPAIRTQPGPAKKKPATDPDAAELAGAESRPRCAWRFNVGADSSANNTPQ